MTVFGHRFDCRKKIFPLTRSNKTVLLADTSCGIAAGLIANQLKLEEKKLMLRLKCPILIVTGMLSTSAGIASAAVVASPGSDLNIGSGYRTASVAKTDPAGTNVLGQDGYVIVGDVVANAHGQFLTVQAHGVNPSYLTVDVIGGIYGGNGAYESIDDPVTTPGATPTKIQSGTVSPGNSRDFSFIVNSSVPATFQVAVLVDNLDNTGYNSAATSIVQTAGPTFVSPGVNSASVVTTSASFNNQKTDIIYFTISGAQTGDRFDVTGTAGPNNDITAAGITFDTVPEPACVAIMGIGAFGLLSRRRRI